MTKLKTSITEGAISSVDEPAAYGTEAPHSASSSIRNPKQLLTRQQVAEEFGIPLKFLENAVWRGNGPPLVKLGHRTVFYRRDDIVAFIEDNLVRS